MKLLGGGLRAGWWTTLIATGSFVAGGLATVRTLNPRGAYGLGWALMFLFGFPWIWGFLNFLLAAGISLLAFATACRLETRPNLRSAVLILAQISALVSHAIGGLLLPILVVTSEVGLGIDRADRSGGIEGGPLSSGRWIVILRQCWPLTTSILMIALWMLTSPKSIHPELYWDWQTKTSFVDEVLRDQSRFFDHFSEYLSYIILLFGGYIGAKWNWRQALPILAIAMLYCLMPARINGSEAVDTRLLPVAIFMGLGLQDWSAAKPLVVRVIAGSGALMLLARLILITLSFWRYDADYKGQLQALDHVQPGSRMFVFWEHSCVKAHWRMSRLDTLPALASLKKEVWINAHWTVPGLDMLRSLYLPNNSDHPNRSAMVWDPKCSGPSQPVLSASIPLAPYDAIDYLWLVDTGPPQRTDNRLTLLWHWKRSYLYRVHHPARQQTAG